MKHYLAFKGTNANLESAWIGFKLRTKYKIGATMKAPEGLPYYLVYHYSQYNWDLGAGCDIRRILLVKVPETSLVTKVPWSPRFSQEDEENAKLRMDYTQRFLKRISLKRIALEINSQHGLGAKTLTVLGEVDKEHFNNANEAMTFFENFFELQRAQISLVP